MPSFLSEGEHVSLGTTAIFKRCVDALKNHKAFAAGAFDEYCNTFVSNLERFRLSNINGEFDDAVIKSIDEFLPFRNEILQLVIVIAQYSPTEEFIRRIHRFFENMIPYLNRPQHILQWSDRNADNFVFIIHELFLYSLAVLMKYDRLEQANYLLEQDYYIPDSSEYRGDVMSSFLVFRRNMNSLITRNKRLNLRRLSIRADLLNERCKGTGIEFRYLMQADFIVFIRAELIINGAFLPWFPDTLLYLNQHSNSPFEVFARSVSKAYFDRVKVLLTVGTPKDLDPLLKSYKDRSRRLPRWDFESIEPEILLGYEKLATRP